MLPVLKILRAHGINGSVHVFLYDHIEKNQKLQNKSSQIFNVQNVSLREKNLAIVKFKDISDRTSAELLKGVILYKEKETLIGCEYYLSDLIGQKIKVTQSSEICTIQNVLNYGAGDILELVYKDQVVLIPFRHEFFSTNRELSIDYIILQSFILNE